MTTSNWKYAYPLKASAFPGIQVSENSVASRFLRVTPFWSADVANFDTACPGFWHVRLASSPVVAAAHSSTVRLPVGSTKTKLSLYGHNWNCKTDRIIKQRNIPHCINIVNHLNWEHGWVSHGYERQNDWPVTGSSHKNGLAHFKGNPTSPEQLLAALHFTSLWHLLSDNMKLTNHFLSSAKINNRKW